MELSILTAFTTKKSFPLRFRRCRGTFLTHEEWEAVKAIFRETVPRFFPANSSIPVFVALQPNVEIRMNTLGEEYKEYKEEKKKSLDDHHEPAPAKAAKPAADAEAHHPRPAAENERAPKKQRREVAPQAAPAAKDSTPFRDMDGDEAVDKRKEEKEYHDLEWEINQWFSPAAPYLAWADPDSNPSVTWPKLQSTFPHLSLLARRFLCIPATSAPSERVWSGFGNVITKTSSSIDSFNASVLILLRRNKNMLNLIDQNVLQSHLNPAAAADAVPE